MNTLLLSAIGAGIGYYAQSKTAKGALIGAAVGAVGSMLMNKSGISQHYTWLKYINPGYKQPILI